jgi:hypothetical protein
MVEEGFVMSFPIGNRKPCAGSLIAQPNRAKRFIHKTSEERKAMIRRRKVLWWKLRDWLMLFEEERKGACPFETKSKVHCSFCDLFMQIYFPEYMEVGHYGERNYDACVCPCSILSSLTRSDKHEFMITEIQEIVGYKVVV